MAKKKRAAVYVRLSKALDIDPETGEVDERNLPIQRKQLEAEAERLGADDVIVFEEPGHSAYKESQDADRERRVKRRPVFFRDLWGALERGEFDLLLATEVDRLTRFMVTGAELAHLCQSRGVTIVCPGQVTLGPEDDPLVFHIHCSLSQSESRTKSQRMKRTWERRRDNGEIMNYGRRPFGLRREGKIMRVVPKEARDIQAAARKIVEGRSLYSVAREMRYPPPYAKRWQPDKLKRSLLAGHLVRYGVLTEDEHKLVVARLDNPRNKRNGPGRPRRGYALSGLVVCGLCGAKLSAGSGQYSCQDCGKLSALTRYVDAVVLEEMGQHLPPEEPNPTRRSPDDEEILRKLAAIEVRMTNLVEGDEDDEFARRRYRKLEADRDALMQQLGSREPDRRWPKGFFAFLDLYGHKEGPVPEDAKAYLEAVVEKVVVKPATKSSRKGFDPERVEVVWR